MTLHAFETKQKRARPEDGLQRYTIQLLRLSRHPKATYFAIPNGEARSHLTGAILNGLGVRGGAPDIAVVLPDGVTGYLELKSSKGRQSPNQKQIEKELTTAGAPYAICRTPEEVFSTLGAWGALRSTKQTLKGAIMEAAR